MRICKLIIRLLSLTVYMVYFSLIPRAINYQGKLTDTTGVGINDTVTMIFRIFTVEDGGAPVWVDTIPNVLITNGLFSVELSGFPDSVDFSDPYWVETEINGEIISPRRMMTSSPYSFRASTVERAVQAIRRRGGSVSHTGTVVLSADDGVTIAESGDSIFVFFGISSSPRQDFHINISQSSCSVYRGSSVTNTISLISLSTGEMTPVNLSIVGLPVGTSATFSPSTCTPTCQSTLIITTSDTTPPGTYTIAVVGRGTEIVRTATFTLTVNIPFDYELLVDPVSRTVDQGGQTTFIATANLLTGFPENVTFSISGLPSGCYATFSPTSCILSCTSTLTISTSATTPPGTYPCQLTAMTSSGIVRTVTCTLTVRYFQFALSISPLSGEILSSGGPISFTLTASRISSTTQEVTFSADSVPSGILVNFSPLSCNPTCNSSISLSSSSATPGIYNVYVIGTGIGGSSDTTSFAISVCTTPGAPRNLTATGGLRSIVLSWQAPDSCNLAITNYQIYRSTSPNPSTILVTVGNVLTYTDTAVTGGTQYYYRIRAVNSYGAGPYSNEVNATSASIPQCSDVVLTLGGTCSNLPNGFRLSGNLSFNGYGFDDNNYGAGNIQPRNVCLLALYGNRGSYSLVPSTSSYAVAGGTTMQHWFGNCSAGSCYDCTNDHILTSGEDWNHFSKGNSCSGDSDTDNTWTQLDCIW